jgi:hypothetical protein
LFADLKNLSIRRSVSFMGSKNNPKARGTELVVQELKGELLIYDLNINKTYCLNPTSAAIWNLCDGNNSVADITKQAGKKLKQPVTDDLVWLALDQFKEDNLLDSNQEIEIKFDGSSRREVIRKVGLASMIALPVIASLVAPTAAMATSGGTVPLYGTCTTSNECSGSNTCNQCFGGGSCPFGSTRCCANANSSLPTVGVGFGIGCFADPAGCSAQGALACCSGNAVATPGLGCPDPTKTFQCNCV